MDYFNISLPPAEINGKNVLALAHLGDCVFELMVRTHLCINHTFTSNSLHKETLKYVSATAQAASFRRIEESLTEEERSVFLRGRNAHVKTVPKSCDRGDYHAATGLETLFGHLYLSGKTARLNELFASIIASDT